MIIENLGIPPPLVPAVYSIGMSGNERWGNIRVFIDHFAYFYFPYSHLKSSYKLDNGS